MKNWIMDDCMFYKDKLHRCMALTELVCKNKECSFYKPKDTDGSDNKEDEKDNGNKR